MKSFTDMALLFSPEDAHPMIRRYLTSPYSAIEDVRHLESITKIFVHSPEDKIAPYSQAEEVYAAAVGPKAFLTHSGGHVSALVTEKDDMVMLMTGLIE